VVNVIVDVPKGSANKYEFDHELGVVRLDRVLPSAQFYPADYGFIPQTLGEDGDPLDVLALSTYPLLPGILVEVRVVALMEMEDEKGPDAKIIGVVAEDPRFDHIRDLGDLPLAFKQEIQHFFETYKNLEAHKGKWVKVTAWRDRQAALEEIRSGLRRRQA
jgi:inorganic pyrophosphatase